MGLSYSKSNQKLTKVAPIVENELSRGIPGSRFNARMEPGYWALESMPQSCAPYERQLLPPLRETLHGRYSAVPKPISFDIAMENEEASIIKSHPPRRLQRLEPTVLPSILTSEQLLNSREQAGKELDTRGQTAKHTAGRRQHLHKMQMLELNRKRQEMNHMQSQAELKRNLHREARINKQKMRELKAKKVRENVHRRNDDDEYVTVERDETFNMHHGYSWNADSLEQSDTPEFYRSKDSKLEAWLRKHQAGTETVCDSSSSDSLDSWKGDEKNIHHRAPLIRTKTEKIPTFDEFFDQNI